MPAKSERPAPMGAENAPEVVNPSNEARFSISVSDILPPETLEEYEKTLPGFKADFFAHWREDRKLAQDAERAQIQAQNRASFSLAFVTILIAITVSLFILGVLGMTAFLIYKGQFGEAVALLGGAVSLSIIGNYIAGKTKN